MTETANEGKVNSILIDEDKVTVLKDFLIKNKREADKARSKKDWDQYNKINRLMKNEVIEFFKKHDLDIDENTKLNEIGKTSLVQQDIKETRIASHSNFKNMVWATITEDDIKHDIWWICWSEECGIYVFNLPKSNRIQLDDFKKTNKTKEDIKKDKKHKQRGDIVLDMQNDSFTEVLGSNHSDFNQYLRAKLDFNNKKLFIYPVINSENSEDKDETSDKLPQETLKRPDNVEPLEWISQRMGKEFTSQQKEVIKHNYEKDDAALVVAGAGCGKTTTMLGHALYLIETGKIAKPEDLLLVVFNNKNKYEFKKKLQDYGYKNYRECAHTFHSLGLNICKEQNKDTQTFDPEKENPLDDTIKEYAKYASTENTKWINDLWAFTSEPRTNRDDTQEDIYKPFIASEDMRKQILSLEQENYSLSDEYKTWENDLEKLRILNFLSLYDIEYTISNKNEKQISITLKEKQNIQLKWNELSINNDFSKLKEYFDSLDLIECKEVEKKINKAILRARLYEFQEKVKFFITVFKIKHYKENPDKIRSQLDKDKSLTKRERKRVEQFFDLLEPIYENYGGKLKTEGKIDYNDMLNEAAEYIDNGAVKRKYKYILIDEYQDVAEDNFRLIKALKEKTGAKLMCVGDDWQSIYSWRGSELKFFRDFNTFFPKAKTKPYEITETFRNGQNLLDLAGTFIRKDKELLTKESLKSNMNMDTEIKFVYYDRNKNKKQWDNFIENVKNEYQSKDSTQLKIFVLARYKADCKFAGYMEDSIFKEPFIYKEKIIEENKNGELVEKVEEKNGYMTIHTAKGLEADVVIIINLFAGNKYSKLSFPSNIKNDIVFKPLYENREQVAKMEERRLMYVAMTRAKKACYFWTPKEYQSEFVEELQNIQKSVDSFVNEPQKLPDEEKKIAEFEQDIPTSNANKRKILTLHKSPPDVDDIATNIDYSKLVALLHGAGKGVFAACYKVIAENYNGNRNVIKNAIAEYGLKTTKKPYTDGVISTKTSKSCAIFKKGWEKEALRLCADENAQYNQIECLEENKDRSATKNMIQSETDNSEVEELKERIKQPESELEQKNDKNLQGRLHKEIEKKLNKFNLSVYLKGVPFNNELKCKHQKYIQSPDPSLAKEINAIYQSFGINMTLLQRADAIDDALAKKDLKDKTTQFLRISCENAQKGIKENSKISSNKNNIESEYIKQEPLQHPKKEFIINGKECSSKEFEKSLQDTLCVVNVTLFYSDKPTEHKEWTVRKFTTTSSLSSNLNRGYLRDWREKHIVGIRLELKQ